MAELKTKASNASVDAFLAQISDVQKRADSVAICELMKAVTGEKPKMWGESIVGYGSYHYRYASGQEGDWPLVGFSPRKNNITFYIMSGFDEYAKSSGYDPKPLLDKLGKYSTGKACLYIKRLSDVDNDVLSQLINESYNYMKANNA